VIKASCIQWFSSTGGTHALNRSWVITAYSTGSVSTAPAITRRARSAISAWRSAASVSCVSSTWPSAAPGGAPLAAGAAAGPRPEAAWSWATGAALLAPAPPSAAGSTISVPWIMFIPHANPNSPASAGSSRTVVRW
jgi:hypothetical protein